MRTAIVAAVLALAGAAIATPTTPFEADVSALPWRYFNGYTKTFMPTLGPQTTARVRYNASNEALGWDYFRFETVDPSPVARDNEFFDSGYTEGYLTQARLVNTPFKRRPVDPRVTAWVKEHKAWIEETVAARPGEQQWAVVGKVMDQMRGIAAGFNNATNGHYGITFEDVFFFNFHHEWSDITAFYQLKDGRLPPLRTTAIPTHCSALIRPVKGDMFVAHATWTEFVRMSVRVFKAYVFAHVPAKSVSFSTFPATVASGDDWYMTGQDLVVQETTNIVLDNSLYAGLTPKSLSEFLRVMSANYIAAGGEEWTTLFSRFNSGTYNNQYMVVDWKKFAPDSTIAPDTLWIAEQIPGWVERADVSSVLNTKGYWASYNVPYFPNIYEAMGYGALKKQQGSYWSYTKYARPEIFARQAPSVQNLADMMHMMRFNNYKHDPFSLIPNCRGATNVAECEKTHSSMLAIASRGDLMTVYNTTEAMRDHYGVLYGWLAQGCFGGIDSKITSYTRRHKQVGVTVSGPTNDIQPTFKWGGACTGHKPAWAPPVFDFPWVEWKQ